MNSDIHFIIVKLDTAEVAILFDTRIEVSRLEVPGKIVSSGICELSPDGTVLVVDRFKGADKWEDWQRDSKDAEIIQKTLHMEYW